MFRGLRITVGLRFGVSRFCGLESSNRVSYFVSNFGMSTPSLVAATKSSLSGKSHYHLPLLAKDNLQDQQLKGLLPIDAEDLNFVAPWMDVFGGYYYQSILRRDDILRRVNRASACAASSDILALEFVKNIRQFPVWNGPRTSQTPNFNAIFTVSTPVPFSPPQASFVEDNRLVAYGKSILNFTTYQGLRGIQPFLFVMAVAALFLIFCGSFLCFSEARNDLKPSDSIRGKDTLVSNNGVFELGFFKTGGSFYGNYYLGIWFVNDPYRKPVWVANRDSPLLDTSGGLYIRNDGNLIIIDKRQSQILLNPAMLATTGDTTAELLDSGNFVLVEGGGNSIWESFYYPSDTFLPGMKLGLFNLGTSHVREQFIVSWQSPSVPAGGSFVFAISSTNWTQLKVWHRDDVSRMIGFWDGGRFRFLYNSSLDYGNFTYVTNANETYLTFEPRSKANLSWFVIAPSGEIQAFNMIGKEISMVYSPICTNITSVSATDCFIDKPSMCNDNSKFLRMDGLMPDKVAINESDRLGISDCEINCRSNCACVAFSTYRDDGTGCQFVYGDLEQLMNGFEKGNVTMFVRGNSTDISILTRKNAGRRKKLQWSRVFLLVAGMLVLIIIVLIIVRRWKSHSSSKKMEAAANQNLELFLIQLGSVSVSRNAGGCPSKVQPVKTSSDHKLPILSFSCIVIATDNFSAANKIGEGGFGPVYKGVLSGYDIAVKRLSRKSGQGLEEFMNEVQLISKLQHRNLVRLLGCCIDGDEKILIYEYMKNKSLDSFLFDLSKGSLVDWNSRARIIEGIAQGLLYLHEYSRLRIIHRDLKTSNILLDDEMNPKISDFGMARIFRENEARAWTTRVVGTYGYMSPEYAVHGVFSTKSDVFSFGVIMLEILSGKRITVFHSDRSLNLLGYAWELWSSNHGADLMDPALVEAASHQKFLVCLNVALLCIQEHPQDRPNMSDVVSMLISEGSSLPVPKHPAFSSHVSSSSSSRRHDQSANELSLTIVEAR